MLNFFRKHQRIFFIFVTTLVVLSFSFFGTYGARNSETSTDRAAFKTIDGSTFMRSDLERFAMFIGTDNDDKIRFEGVWGPNFLNDGVLRKDFLETGLADLLAEPYLSQLSPDLMARHEREKRFTPYSHPQAKFLTVETVWGYFAPELKAEYEALHAASDLAPTGIDLFRHRTRLYLCEQQFPQATLKQILRYQERQYDWIQPDAQLPSLDLSLFGYHTIEDWFGPRFIRLVAEFIVDSAIIAKEKGYLVSKEEALADLRKNAEMSFQQLKKNHHVSVNNSQEMLQEQLRLMGLDISSATKIWQQVLLLRRLFNDVGQSVLIDALAHQQYNQYAEKSADIDLYQLPQELALNDYRSLQNLETYLDAVAKRDPQQPPFVLPQQFLSAAEVKRHAPELVQKRYLVQVSETSKAELKLKSTLKEIWDWEVAEKNWPLLIEKFPVINTTNTTTEDERFQTLESLDQKTRGHVDNYAQDMIFEAHPEWVTAALDEAQSRTLSISVRRKGGSAPLPGIVDRKAFMALLDAEKTIPQYSGDGELFYRITVLDHSLEEEVLSFAEANRDKILDTLCAQRLEQYYTKIRDAQPSQFKRADGSWKLFPEVKDQVADLLFEPVLKALHNDFLPRAPSLGIEVPPAFTGAFCAKIRFHHHLDHLKKLIQAGSEEHVISSAAEHPSSETTSDRLPMPTPLQQQWNVHKSSHLARRSHPDLVADPHLFKLDVSEWSKVCLQPNKSPFFYKVVSNTPGKMLSTQSMDHGLKALSVEAKCHLMNQVLTTIQERQPLSLDTLHESQQDDE
jgi:GcvH upstream region-like protein